MTDKQIIIDGVDVHWCEHYTGNIGYLTDKNWTCRAKIQGTKCEDWSDCYFKRWQRKEQECEELKEARKNSRCAWKSLEGTFCPEAQQQLDQLKAENDKLMKQHQADKGLITSTGKMNYQLIQEYDKLKTALTEIKVLSENVYCLTNALNRDMALFAKQILQKISEVLE